MGDKISALPESSTIASTDVLLKSNAAGSTEIITFDNFQTNFNFLRTTGSNTMQIGVSDYSLPVIRIPSNNKYVGIGGGSNFVPSSILHISGYAGQNAILTIQSASGYTGYLKLADNNYPWYLGNVPSGKFFISGDSANIYYPSINIDTDGRMLITDGSQYSVANVESDINMQFFAKTGLRMSFDNNVISNDIDFDYSGIQSSKNLYINYYQDGNITSGTFFGLSGAVFTDHDNGLTRIGNNDDRSPDARLMVTNDTTNGTTYKTVLIEDVTSPNLHWRKIGSSTTVSATFDPSTSQLYWGRNKSAGAISALDPIIFDLANKRIGIGVDPSSSIDISGASSTLFTRYQSASETMVIKYQINSEVGSAFDEIFTTYSSGANNNMIVGYKFQGDNIYGDTNGLGVFFWQTGTSSNVYNSSRNVATISDHGDLDINRYYSTNNKYCQGKFIQTHRATSSDAYDPVYLHLDNINYNHQNSGSLSYHTLCQLEGIIEGVDFTCKLNPIITNGTGYLVFNRFNDLIMTEVGGIDYVSGTPRTTSVGTKTFFQLWDAANNINKDPQDIDLSTFVYVSGAITGQDFFNLKARRSNTTDGQKFYGASLNTLEFNKFDNIGWVAYAVTGQTSNDVVHLSGAKNLNTIVSYFVESDTSTEVGTYIQQ
jgi:hypothetical protein